MGRTQCSKILFVIAAAVVVFPKMATAECKPDSAGKYSDKIVTKRGKNEEPSFHWGKGEGCILRPIRAAWAVLHNEKALKWSGTKSHKVTAKTPTPTEFTHVYDALYRAGNIIVTVSWNMDWNHILREGTTRDPVFVQVDYAKVKGTSYIPRWNGTITLKKVTDEVSDFEMINEIKAENTDDEDAEKAVLQIASRLSSFEPNFEPLGGAQ